MLENFGARLRQRRVEQGISLNAIAQQTKIKLSLLEGLERDDVSRWPSGIFRRAYIRAYAQAIGLDPDVVLREFLEVHAEPAEVFTAALETALAADRAHVNAGTASRLRGIVGSALGSFSLFRRTPASELPVMPVDVRTSGDIPEEDDREDLAVAYPSHGLAWAETADDAGLELLETEAPAAARSGALSRTEPAPPPLIEPAEHHAPSAEPVSADANAQAPREASAFESTAAAGEQGAIYPDLLALARLCTDFGRIDGAEDLTILLEDAARLLNATGLIVWIWDEAVDGLRPVLAHGYSDKVLAHLPTVAREADNATAAAFRAAETCAIKGSDRASGALVVPLMTQSGCAGVLAIELQPGVEHTDAVRAVATIIAALIAQLIARAYATDVESQPELTAASETEAPPRAARGRFGY